jgi:hypothetical protein
MDLIHPSADFQASARKQARNHEACARDKSEICFLTSHRIYPEPAQRRQSHPIKLRLRCIMMDSRPELSRPPQPLAKLSGWNARLLSFEFKLPIVSMIRGRVNQFFSPKLFS